MEEVSSLSTHLMLNLGAGCTAPPPTPVRRTAGPSICDNISLHVHHSDADADAFWSSASTSGPRLDAVEFVDDDGPACSSSKIISQNSTPPSKVELDELALYLMQQSLCSPPTLLASPSSRRKREISPVITMGACANKSGSSNESKGDEKETLLKVEGLSTYSCSMEGFCEDSKMGIQRACQEEGAFYVQITDMDKDSWVEIDHLFKQFHSMNSKCLIGSCPLLPLSQLMTSKQYNHGFSTISSFPQEEGSTFELSFGLPLSAVENTLDANFRETMTMFANLLVEISKEVLKNLLEEICIETSTHIRDYSLKPLLYIYENGDQQAYVSMRDEDVVLSILSRRNVNHHKGESLLVVLGNHIENWSKGKFKAPLLQSLCNLLESEVCIQLALIYYI